MSILTWFRDKIYGKRNIPPVENQIAEDVSMKPKRATLRGRFVADNPDTPENEAWVGGKAPPKKTKKSKKSK